MNVKPMLGEYELVGVQTIESAEQRSLVEHAVPGLAGNYIQDMGTVPNRMTITGTRHGDEDRDNFLTAVREIFNAGEPTTFVADINTATEVTNVVIEDLQVAEIAGTADSFHYRVTLKKYIEPPEPPPTGMLDAGILADAASLADALEVLDALGNVPNLSNPTEPLTGALDGVVEATSGMDQAVADLTELLG